jgi:prepilin-type N-terminal cleavage/methylation domain-containing protein
MAALINGLCRRVASRQAGLSLIELLVAMAMFTIVIGAITSMVIQSMKSQQEITADYRSQLNVREALYDMEKNIAEAKRHDALDNQPVFQDDLIAFPSQNGSEWITYWYTNTHPSSGGKYTIVRIATAGMPSLPITVVDTDKQLILVNPDDSVESKVDRESPGAPIFTYYDENGTELATPIVNPREVRSVQVSFKSTASTGHADDEPTVSSSRINLRNF